MWFKNFITGLFNKFVQAFKDLLTAAFPIAKQIVMGQLSEFAQEAVKELSVQTITNEEKRKLAFEKVKFYAEENAIDARDSLINVLIELAVQKFKK